MMLSQPRVLLAMAHDGLLPHTFFGAVHERFRTPYKSTILTGIAVGAMAAFLPIDVLLMFSLPAENWVRLAVWLGLLIFVFYGRKHSHMNTHLRHEIIAHGVSPQGQAVGDPDAPPDSPHAPSIRRRRSEGQAGINAEGGAEENSSAPPSALKTPSAALTATARLCSTYQRSWA